jgi:hypothetical protein
MALAGRSSIMIVAVGEKGKDTRRQEQRERPQPTNRKVDGDGQHAAQPLDSTGVGEVVGRIGNVGTERITLDDGTVLSLPWFFRVGTSELMRVGTMLKVKYENRDAEKVMAFVEVSEAGGKEMAALAVPNSLTTVARRAALSHQ